MVAVVNDITRDDQTDGRDVDHARLIGIAMPDLDETQLVHLELEDVTGGRLGDDRRIWNLFREILVPSSCAKFRVCVKAHDLDRSRRSIGFGTWETFDQLGRPEPMVAVTMSGNDRRQSLTT